MHILKPLPGILQKTGHILADSIALWPMNSLGNRIFDLSGRGQTGILQPGTSWTPGTSGRHGPAVEFDGISGHIVVQITMISPLCVALVHGYICTMLLGFI